MQFNPATKVRKYFQESIDHVHYSAEPMVITKHGKPWVVIQPLNLKDKGRKKTSARK